MRINASVISALLLCAGCRHQTATPAVWSVSAGMKGHTLTIGSDPAHAGAITTLTWNGKQFIDIHDHGRELQSAASFDGLGECYNPTEAGSLADATSDTSTSKLRYFTASSNQIKSCTQMAFWTSVNQPYPMGHGTDTSIKTAQNKTSLSDHLLTKHITIGYSGLDNVVEYLVTFHVPEDHHSATFECVACYFTSDFSLFRTFDPSSGVLTTYAPTTKEQDIPVILSTPDAQYALGIYSPDLPQSGWPVKGYGAVDFPTNNARKLKGVFHTNDIPAGDYNYRWYLVIGTLSDVTSGMTTLHKNFHP